MVANTTGPIWELVPFTRGQQFASGDASTKKTLMTAGANGARIDELKMCSNDTVAINLQLYVQIGGAGTDFYIGVVNIPISAGYAGVAPVDGLLTTDPVLQYRLLGPNDVLKGACLATMTAAKVLDVTSMGGDY